MEALGSGSDYTVFIHHLGIASINLGYGGEDQGDGQYHSIYDDFYWYYALSGHGLCLWACAGPNGRNDDDADG